MNIRSVLRRSTLGALGALALAWVLSVPAARAQEQKVLKFIPQADLRILDPITTTAYITRNHGYMIYDTLFATDAKFQVQPQMVDKYELSKDQLTYTFTLRAGLIAQGGVILRHHFVGPRRIRKSRFEIIENLLGQKPRNSTVVIQQIGIVRIFCQRLLKNHGRSLQFSRFEQRNSQRIVGVGFLQMRDRFGGVSLRQQRVTEQAVGPFEIGAKLKRALERRDRGGIIAFLDEHVTEIHKCCGELGIEFRRFLKFHNRGIQLAALLRLDAGMQMLLRRRRASLRCEPQKDRGADHGFSGSRTSRN